MSTDTNYDKPFMATQPAPKRYSFMRYKNSNRSMKRDDLAYIHMKGGDIISYTMILDPNGSPAPFRNTVKPRTSKYVRHIGNKQLAKFTR